MEAHCDYGPIAEGLYICIFTDSFIKPMLCNRDSYGILFRPSG